MTESEIKARALALPGIERLNDMQQRVLSARCNNLILIAPTGSGKTLAFGLRILRGLGEAGRGVNSVIIAPSRELVMQTASVMRQLASGYKTVALYGGHSMADEIASLTPLPDIIVATPGRFLDHLQRATLEAPTRVAMLVLDEYDKSLELGFEAEMKRIVKRLGRVGSVVLTSATAMSVLPDYLGLHDAEVIRTETDSTGGRVETIGIESFSRDKLDTLVALLRALPAGERAIVFVNHRESAVRVYDRLRECGIAAGLYHGALDQQQRVMAVDLFANGTTPILVATDLAARGLDIAGVESVIHYHLPVDEAAWTHRNGRTARQDASGRIYVITSEADTVAQYIRPDRQWQPPVVPEGCAEAPAVGTLYFSAGRKEKVSRGDIVGFILGNSDLAASDIGRIDVHDHYAVAAVPRRRLRELAQTLSAARLKGKRVRVSQVKA